MTAPVRYSDSIAELTKALIKFHRTCPKIPKASRNPFLKSKYADLSTILDVVQPVLNDCDLVIQQHPTPDFGLTTILSHASGEWMASEYRMQPLEAVVERASATAPAVKGITPQSIGSVITYQRRYALGAILNLNIDDDDDAAAAGLQSAEPAKPAGPKKSARELMAEAAAKASGATTPATPATEVAQPVETGVTSSPEAASPPLADTSAAVVDPTGESTKTQRERIEALFTALSVPPETQQAILRKRGVSVLRSLNHKQAAEIIERLSEKANELAKAAVGDGDDNQGEVGVSQAGVMAADVNGPATDQQVAAIKAALTEWEQRKKGVTNEFVARLNGAGFPKIASLTFDQACKLTAAIEAENIIAFFDSMLETAAAG